MVTPEGEALLDEAIFYNRTQSEMIRTLVMEGPKTVKAQGEEEGGGPRRGEQRKSAGTGLPTEGRFVPNIPPRFILSPMIGLPCDRIAGWNMAYSPDKREFGQSGKWMQGGWDDAGQ